MDQQSSAQHAQSPLLPPEDEKTHSANREENQLQFFDSDNSVPPDASQSQASHRDLAYASLVDGNVLHPCFGLRASANGRPNDSILGKTQKSSIFSALIEESIGTSKPD